MQERPVRSRIYLPVVRLGVKDTDWKFVFGATVAAYAVPFLLNWSVWGIPVPLWTCLGTLALSIAFCNYTRLGRPPRWLEHTVQAWFEGLIYRSRRMRRTLPDEEQSRRAHSWIIDREPGRGAMKRHN